MWDFSLFGRRIITVSDRVYNFLMWARTITGVALIGVALIALNFGMNTLKKKLFPEPQLTNTVLAAPATITNPRASDVEPDRLVIMSWNWRYAGGHVKVRSPFGVTKANFTYFCHSDGCEWRAIVKNAADLRLTAGPYLLTTYDADNVVVATFRLDRTGPNTFEVINLYLLTNPENTPMLSIYGVPEHFEPLGRETYLTEPLG